MMCIALRTLSTKVLAACWLIGLSCVGTLPATSWCRAQGAATAADISNDPVFRAWQGNTEVQACGLCHYAAGNEFASRATDFSRLTEVKLWLEKDKHAIARQRIEPRSADEIAALQTTTGNSLNAWQGASNQLSYAMCKQLGWDVTTEVGYGQFRDNCLTCHGGYEQGTIATQFSRDAHNQPGISCTYCHQEGQNYNWIDAHSGASGRQDWRFLTPSAKSLQGMRNLATAQSQADLCLTCHVGDMKRNMFVTHDMYAAGHPPLPNVELRSLIQAMPTHWRENRELFQTLAPAQKRDAFFRLNFPELTSHADVDASTATWDAQALLVGSVSARKQSLMLVVGAAKGKHWGDYALYDCSACHHTLRLPSARQAARMTSTPGRPRLTDWPIGLSSSAEKLLDPEGAIASQAKRLETAVNAQPFGHREQVHEAALGLVSSLETLLQQANVQGVHHLFVKQFVDQLARTPKELLIDYSSARQISQALRTLNNELTQLEKPLPPRVHAAIQQLGHTGEPASSEGSTLTVSTAIPGGRAAEIFPKFVRDELARQAAYDAEQFHSQLQTIARQLDK